MSHFKTYETDFVLCQYAPVASKVPLPCPPPASFHVLFGEQLLVGNFDVPQVPQDPEDQAEEHEQRPCEDQQVPEAEGSEDTDEEQNEAYGVHEHSDQEEDQTTSNKGGVIHVERQQNSE